MGSSRASPACSRRVRPQEPDPVAARKLVLSDERVRQPTLQRMYLVPSYTTGKPGEAEALEVLAQALGAHATGRLNKRLVLDRKLAVAASAWYSGNALDDHTFGVYAVPAEGVSLEELETALDETLDALSRDASDRCRDRACQDEARRRSRLSARQPQLACPLFRLGAHHRVERAANARLAGRHRARHRGGYRRLLALARQEAFGHRISERRSALKPRLRRRARSARGVAAL